MKTYIIDYIIYDVNNNYIRNGTIRAKNKNSELEAKIFTETNLKKLYKNMDRLIITSCKEENPFRDIFGDIFKF